MQRIDDLLAGFDRSGVRYLLVGGQAMRLAGMPRFSMDWDFFIPPRDMQNLARLNSLLESELDEPLVPLGPRGENFIQTYQTRWGVLQFHLGLPGVPKFDQAEARAAIRHTENGTPVKCLSGPDLLAAKRAADRPLKFSRRFLLRVHRAMPLRWNSAHAPSFSSDTASAPVPTPERWFDRSSGVRHQSGATRNRPARA